LILLDLKMPGLDGYEVLKHLKRDRATQDIPVIVVTGSVTNEEVKRKKVLALGAAQFLTKPFAIDDFVEEIRRVLTGPSPAT
jgi:CheY-like chemotaxis protein